MSQQILHVYQKEEKGLKVSSLCYACWGPAVVPCPPLAPSQDVQIPLQEGWKDEAETGMGGVCSIPSQLEVSVRGKGERWLSLMILMLCSLK